MLIHETEPLPCTLNSASQEQLDLGSISICTNSALMHFACENLITQLQALNAHHKLCQAPILEHFLAFYNKFSFFFCLKHQQVVILVIIPPPQISLLSFPSAWFIHCVGEDSGTYGAPPKFWEGSLLLLTNSFPVVRVWLSQRICDFLTVWDDLREFDIITGTSACTLLICQPTNF